MCSHIVSFVVCGYPERKKYWIKIKTKSIMYTSCCFFRVIRHTINSIWLLYIKKSTVVYISFIVQYFEKERYTKQKVTESPFVFVYVCVYVCVCKQKHTESHALLLRSFAFFSPSFICTWVVHTKERKKKCVAA